MISLVIIPFVFWFRVCVWSARKLQKLARDRFHRRGVGNEEEDEEYCTSPEVSNDDDVTEPVCNKVARRSSLRAPFRRSLKLVLKCPRHCLSRNEIRKSTPVSAKSHWTSRLQQPDVQMSSWYAKGDLKSSSVLYFGSVEASECESWHMLPKSDRHTTSLDGKPSYKEAIFSVDWVGSSCRPTNVRILTPVYT